MMVLLDTSVIIDAINERRGRRLWVRNLAIRGDTLACCAINVTEVYANVFPEEEEVTSRVFHGLECIEVGRDLAERAGRLKFEWERRGQTLSVPDVIIAAAALTYGLTLATDNRKHFPMPDLRFLDLPADKAQ
ncbi:MAG TPA: type II toxin-antitoxin system VapC family toxin [Terriglobia bacterium]|nr:type II toxin-antitoxin system VapC family toxin [Terriglobia bacterium]